MLDTGSLIPGMVDLLIEFNRYPEAARELPGKDLIPFLLPRSQLFVTRNQKSNI
jgi:hypothetical protein